MKKLVILVATMFLSSQYVSADNNICLSQNALDNNSSEVLVNENLIKNQNDIKIKDAMNKSCDEIRNMNWENLTSEQEEELNNIVRNKQIARYKEEAEKQMSEFKSLSKMLIDKTNVISDIIGLIKKENITLNDFIKCKFKKGKHLEGKYIDLKDIITKNSDILVNYTRGMQYYNYSGSDSKTISCNLLKLLLFESISMISEMQLEYVVKIDKDGIFQDYLKSNDKCYNINFFDGMKLSLYINNDLDSDLDND
ncbi:MAG: hypothetical protein IJ848_01690 [Alphaproteobacteria bacterium]|nr:hypothetical protein [Alphaproteobacteria bacterium]